MITENAAFAIPYDWEIRSRLQRFARRRDTSVDLAKFPIEENEDVKRDLKSDLGKGRPPQGPPPRTRSNNINLPRQARKIRRVRRAIILILRRKAVRVAKILTLFGFLGSVARRARARSKKTSG